MARDCERISYSAQGERFQSPRIKMRGLKRFARGCRKVYKVKPRVQRVAGFVFRAAVDSRGRLLQLGKPCHASRMRSAFSRCAHASRPRRFMAAIFRDRVAIEESTVKRFRADLFVKASPAPRVTCALRKKRAA